MHFWRAVSQVCHYPFLGLLIESFPHHAVFMLVPSPYIIAWHCSPPSHGQVIVFSRATEMRVITEDLVGTHQVQPFRRCQEVCLSDEPNSSSNSLDIPGQELCSIWQVHVCVSCRKGKSGKESLLQTPLCSSGLRGVLVTGVLILGSTCIYLEEGAGKIL